MGKLTLTERLIVFWAVLALVFAVLAVAELFVNAGANSLDLVELSFLSLVMSRVL